MRHLILLFALLLVGCSSAQTFGPLATSTPVASPAHEWNAEDEEDYRQFVRTTADRVERGMLVLFEQPDAASRNATSMLDAAWIEREMERIADVREVARDIQEREPPPRFEEFHDQYTRVGELLEEAMTLYTEGLDELDTRKLERSAELITDAALIIRELDIEDLQ